MKKDVKKVKGEMKNKIRGHSPQPSNKSGKNRHVSKNTITRSKLTENMKETKAANAAKAAKAANDAKN